MQVIIHKPFQFKIILHALQLFSAKWPIFIDDFVVFSINLFDEPFQSFCLAYTYRNMQLFRRSVSHQKSIVKLKFTLSLLVRSQRLQAICEILETKEIDSDELLFSLWKISHLIPVNFE